MAFWFAISVRSSYRVYKVMSSISALHRLIRSRCVFVLQIAASRFLHAFSNSLLRLHVRSIVREPITNKKKLPIYPTLSHFFIPTKSTQNSALHVNFTKPHEERNGGDNIGLLLPPIRWPPVLASSLYRIRIRWNRNGDMAVTSCESSPVLSIFFSLFERGIWNKNPASYFCNVVPDNNASAMYLKHYVVYDTEWGEKNAWDAKNVTLQRETVTRCSVILLVHLEGSQLQTDSLILENRELLKVDIEDPQYLNYFFF